MARPAGVTAKTKDNSRKPTPRGACMSQADVLMTIKPPSLKHQIDELIKPLMGKHFGFHSSPASTDARYNQHAKDSDGRTTGAEQWRQLRKFAEDVRAL